MKSVARLMLAFVSLMLVFAPGMSGAQGTVPAASVPAARQANDVVIITVRGPIDRWTELSVKRRITMAEESGADAFVIEVDSPGGEVGAVLEICNAIKGSTITNTVAWVNPNAYSGGAIVALACREIVTSSPASMGDAFPITMDLQGVRGLTPDERTKFLPPLLTEVADSARRYDYDEFLVQAMVVDGIELWSVRDEQTGRVWFINEAEYRILFDDDPPRGKPVLTSVTGGRASQNPIARSPAPVPAEADAEESDAEPRETPEDAGQTGESLPEETGGMTAPPREGERGPGGASPPGDRPVITPGSGRSDSGFTPAAPSVADLSGPISMGLQQASQRPTFTRADRGRYVDPVYICDGSGPIVLRDDQLRAFGFSSGVIRSDEELRAFMGARRMIRIEQTWSEAMVRFLMHPVVRGVLIVIFLLGMFVEMSSPGMILPGALAIGALVGIIAPPMLVGMAGWWEIAVLGVGILCLLVELLVLPGFGVFGIIGLVALFVGLVGTFIPGDRGGLFGGDKAAQTGLLYGVATIVLSTTTAGILIYFMSKQFGTIPMLNRLVLDSTRDLEESDLAVMAPEPVEEARIGDLGVAVSPLRPSGRIEVNGRMLDAVAQRGYIDHGDRIEVMGRRGFSWVVRPAGSGVDDAKGSGSA